MVHTFPQVSGMITDLAHRDLSNLEAFCSRRKDALAIGRYEPSGWDRVDRQGDRPEFRLFAGL